MFLVLCGLILMEEKIEILTEAEIDQVFVSLKLGTQEKRDAYLRTLCAEEKQHVSLEVFTTDSTAGSNNFNSSTEGRR